MDSEQKGVTVVERKPKVEPDVQYTNATVLQTVTNADGSVSIYHAEPNTQVRIDQRFYYIHGLNANVCM